MLKKSSRFIIILNFILPVLQATHLNRKFFHVADKKNWKMAQEYCRLHHTDLGIFRNKFELGKISAKCTTQSQCWIGLHKDKNDPNVWTWSDGRKAGFTNWHSDEPDNTAGNEDCVGIVGSVWYDVPCNNEFGFVCHEDNLILVKENKTWEEALEHCRTLDINSTSNSQTFPHVYDLPSMHKRFPQSNSHAKKVIPAAQTEEVWIGLRFLAGKWLWVDGRRNIPEFPGCPAPGMYCGTMSKTGYILPNKNCVERRNFFCSSK